MSGFRSFAVLAIVFFGLVVAGGEQRSARSQETAPRGDESAQTAPITATSEQAAAPDSAAPDSVADHAGEHGTQGHGHNLGAEMPLIAVAPFALLLLSIAIMPLTFAHWWEHNRNKGIVALVLSLPLLIYVGLFSGPEGVHELIDKVKEYISFMTLLGALFVISGGIYIQGSLSGTPLANTGLMALGAVLANLIGTTGASMVLIRPLLRANVTRHRKSHIVIFFIFIVSNCGGLLTPLGDPPLFLGYLKGVPFSWTLQLWPIWLKMNLCLLIVFNIVDAYIFAKEEKLRPGSQLEEVLKHEPLRVHGILNCLFLLGVVVAIIAALPFGVQEGAMIGLTMLSYFTTAPENHKNNRFTFGPIIEVAVLFAGIFITMAPALLILNAWGQGTREVLGFRFGLSENWQFFWATGILSSFLDNAPTYLTFASTACGLNQIPLQGPYLAKLLEAGPDAVKLLSAISCAAVFMGANTYIGNGPNFMVKAIAEENGVPMPDFFRYMLYSGGILVPLLIVTTLVFFR